MGCRAARRLIQAALDGEAGAAERARLNAHLEGCTSCRGEWERMQVLEAILSREGLLDAPPELGAAVAGRLRDEAGLRDDARLRDEAGLRDDANLKLPWQHRAPDKLAATRAEVLGMAGLAALSLAAWWLAVRAGFDRLLVEQVGLALGAARVLASTFPLPPPNPGLTLGLQLSLGLLLAAAWFAALVAPRRPGQVTFSVRAR